MIGRFFVWVRSIMRRIRLYGPAVAMVEALVIVVVNANRLVPSFWLSQRAACKLCTTDDNKICQNCMHDITGPHLTYDWWEHFFSGHSYVVINYLSARQWASPRLGSAWTLFLSPSSLINRLEIRELFASCFAVVEFEGIRDRSVCLIIRGSIHLVYKVGLGYEVAAALTVRLVLLLLLLLLLLLVWQDVRYKWVHLFCLSKNRLGPGLYAGRKTRIWSTMQLQSITLDFAKNNKNNQYYYHQHDNNNWLQRQLIL